jgi:fermentation-respiration switch protein FrsA (DUF1100 family)
MIILLGLGVLIGVILIYMIVIIFFPVLSLPDQPIPKLPGNSEREAKLKSYRQEVQFPVDGLNIHAWLYLPKNVSGPVPCVIMANGFGGVKDCALDNYVERFLDAGLAALSFDYRHFGESEGQPRQLYDAIMQLDDFQAAIVYARSRDEIDANNIFLWGTSAGAGYGLTIAARDKQIAGVITQCGAIDHKADSKLFMDRDGIGFMLALIPHAQRDKGRSRFGLSPHRFPIVGKPGTRAMLATPGAFDGYAKILGSSKTFRNEVCGRLLFAPHAPDATESAKDVACPVLFVACEHDNLASPESHKRAAEHLGDKATVISYPIGHFDIYEGEYFEQAVSEMAAFIKKQLTTGEKVIDGQEVIV